MNFQQLKSIRETVRCGFNLTDVATALHTSQPGVRRQGPVKLQRRIKNAAHHARAAHGNADPLLHAAESSQMAAGSPR